MCSPVHGPRVKTCDVTLVLQTSVTSSYFLHLTSPPSLLYEPGMTLGAPEHTVGKTVSLCPRSSQASGRSVDRRACAPSLLKAQGEQVVGHLPEVGGGSKERGHLGWALKGA